MQPHKHAEMVSKAMSLVDGFPKYTLSYQAACDLLNYMVEIAPPMWVMDDEQTDDSTGIVEVSE